MIRQISDIYEISSDENLLMFKIHNLDKDGNFIYDLDELQNMVNSMNKNLEDTKISAIYYLDVFDKPEAFDIDSLIQMRDQLTQLIEEKIRE